MTNNPTIDGVSRELLERVIDTYTPHDNNPHCHLDSDQEALNELRALLDAPAVERQEPKAYDFNPTPYARQFIYSAMPPGKYIAVEHYAALQSRITQIEAEAMYAAAGYQAARARIEELESGRGEPDAYQVVSDRERRFTRCKISAADCARHIAHNGELNVRIDPLFTAPPAPVAVVLPEPRPITEGMHRLMNAYALGEFSLEGGSPTVEAMSCASYDERDISLQALDFESYSVGYQSAMYEEVKSLLGLIACLDATDALNGEKP